MPNEIMHKFTRHCNLWKERFKLQTAQQRIKELESIKELDKILDGRRRDTKTIESLIKNNVQLQTNLAQKDKCIGELEKALDNIANYGFESAIPMTLQKIAQQALTPKD